MKPSKEKDTYRPFAGLERLLTEKGIPLAPFPADYPEETPKPLSHPEDERRLFEKEMADVTPLDKDNRLAKWPTSNWTIDSEADEDGDVLLKLKDLVDNGDGFVISQTAEYIQGASPHVSPDIIQRLHHGRFSIQDHIDLHGLNVPQAETAFNRFLQDALRTGKRAVLIVHGRGLSSADTPVLKNKVYQWLTRGRWRKWVVAFTSARACDGGAGATYVLLRRSALTKKRRERDRSPEAHGNNLMIPPE